MATETAIDVVMPQMGVSVSEGTVTKWLKQEGETGRGRRAAARDLDRQGRHRGAEPRPGVVTQILVQEGETVEVGTKLAQIGGSGRRAAGGRAAPEPSPRRRPSRRRRPRPTRRWRPRSRRRREPAAAARRLLRRRSGSDSGNGKAFVSPVVARIASEHGVDPNQVQGTGRGGRVTKKDILGFIESAAHSAARRTGSAPAAPRSPRLRLRKRHRRSRPARSLPRRPGRSRRGAARRDARAHHRDAPRHRRAHAPLARHGRARHERDRGRHVARRRRAQAR